MLERLGVTRILNLVEDREYPPGARTQVVRSLRAAGIVEERFSSQDYGALSASLLDEASELANSWLDEGDLVYIHCRAGWQRSATVAAAVLVRRFGMDPDDALAAINARKPTAKPLPHQRESLLAWWDARPV